MPLPCPINKIDSNVTGLSFAEEICYKVLPTLAADGADAVWYGLEPNSYSDFGGELTMVARSPISANRQNKRGVVTDLDASGGFNIDVTANNLTRLMQGFFFADLREKPTTGPLNAAKIVVSAAAAATDKYTTGATAVVFNKAGYLVKASGFTNAANNGLHAVVSADATGIVVADGLVDEAAPPVAAKVEVVGFEFPTADVAIVKTGNVARLTSTAANLNTLGLIVGEWIFIGGDVLASGRFANNVGYARISAITAAAIFFDDTTFTSVAEVSTGKKIQIFFGDVLKNETFASGLIKRRSYNIERTLGQGPTATQAEYLEGAVPNEFTLHIPEAEKMNADLTYVAANNTQRSGEVGDVIKVGTRVPALGESALNSTSNVYRIKMNVLDPTTSLPTALFGYVTEGEISISNNVTPNKAIGVLGAFEATAGNFVVGGSITAYFTTVPAVRAVRNNADVGFNVILAAANAGMVFDIPLLGLGGGRANVEKDAAIMVPLEPAGAENINGYTFLEVVFPYLPTIAMPA